MKKLTPEQRDWKPRPYGFLAEHENIFEEERLDYIYELHDKMWQLARIIRPGSQGNLKDVVSLILTAHTEPEGEHHDRRGWVCYHCNEKFYPETLDLLDNQIALRKWNEWIDYRDDLLARDGQPIDFPDWLDKDGE